MRVQWNRSRNRAATSKCGRFEIYPVYPKKGFGGAGGYYMWDNARQHRGWFRTHKSAKHCAQVYAAHDEAKRCK